MKKILLLCIVFGILSTACSQKSMLSKLEDEINVETNKKDENSNPNQEADSNSEMDDDMENETDASGYHSEKIDMRDVKGHVIYNPHENKMNCITNDTSEDGNHTIYSIKVLNDEYKWVDGGKSWTVDGGTFLKFEYSSDGELYVLEDESEIDTEDEDGNRMNHTYTIHKWLKDGNMEEVPFEDLNNPIETKFMKNIYLEEENQDEKIPVFLTMKVLENNTMVIFYSNASVSVYDLASGSRLKTIEMDTPLDTAMMVVTRDEIIIANNELPENNDMALEVMDLQSGKRTRRITFGSGIYERNSSNWFMLCNGTEDDLYLLSDEGIFYGELSDSALNLLIEPSTLGIPPALGYQYFARGGMDDFYVTYYEVVNPEAALQDQVAELQMMHYY